MVVLLPVGLRRDFWVRVTVEGLDFALLFAIEELLALFFALAAAIALASRAALAFFRAASLAAFAFF